MRNFFKLFLIVFLSGGFFYWPNLITAEELGDNLVVQNEENNPEERIDNNQNEEEIISETEKDADDPIIQEGNLVINEFVANPEGDDKKGEWIEIFNKSDNDFDLDGCTIEDGTNKPKQLTNKNIKSNNYLVLEKGDDFSFDLNNNGDVIILKCGEGVDKKDIDKVVYGKADEGKSLGRIPNGEGNFMILDNPTKGEINNYPPVAIAAIIGSDQEFFVDEKVVFSGEESNDEDDDVLTFSWDFGDGSDPTDPSNECETSHIYNKIGTFTVTLTVSDGKEESKDTLIVEVKPIVYSDKVVINEFLPDPEGDDAAGEFIELYNNSDSDVDLKNWKIGDNTTKRYVFPSDAIIEAGNYKVVYYSASKIVLNNIGDSVRLFQPDGNLLEEVKYDKSKTGFSYNRTEGGWKWSVKLTPGAKNIIEEPDEDEEIEVELDDDAKEVSITEAKKLEKGTKVKIEGIVSVAPGIFSDHIFYLSGSGIQIYSYTGGFPALKIGDKISLIGFVSGYGNEMRIRIISADDIKILKHEKAPVPHKIKTGEVAEKFEGSLIEVSGQVIKKQGSSFYMNDGSGETRVYIDPDAEIETEIKKGDFVVATGIVSETSAGYRILPRFSEDIKIVKAASAKASSKKVKSSAKKKLPATGPNIFEPILAGLIFSLIISKKKKVQ